MDPSQPTASKIKRVVVIGAGAVGGSIGGLPAEAGRPVVLIARGDHGKALREDGLTLRLADRRLTIRPPWYERLEDVEWQAGDLALLATKLNDAEQALDNLLAVAGPGQPVACAVNGMQGERWAASRFHTVLSMLVWMPAIHVAPGTVCLHTQGCYGVLDTGPCNAGAGTEIAAELCELLRTVSFDAVLREDIGRWKVAKWVTNLGGAAQALVTDDWKHVADLARAEGERILSAAGIDRVATDELLGRVRLVLEAEIDGELRAGGSTWQSRARGKSLETPWLEGAMADLAVECGESSPVNTLLASAAQELRSLTVSEVLQATGVGRPW